MNHKWVDIASISPRWFHIHLAWTASYQVPQVSRLWTSVSANSLKRGPVLTFWGFHSSICVCVWYVNVDIDIYIYTYMYSYICTYIVFIFTSVYKYIYIYTCIHILAYNMAWQPMFRSPPKRKTATTHQPCFSHETQSRWSTNPADPDKGWIPWSDFGPGRPEETPDCDRTFSADEARQNSRPVAPVVIQISVPISCPDGCPCDEPQPLGILEKMSSCFATWRKPSPARLRGRGFWGWTCLKIGDAKTRRIDQHFPEQMCPELVLKTTCSYRHKYSFEHVYSIYVYI